MLSKPLYILVVDDDEGHSLAVMRAFETSGLSATVTIVASLEEYRDQLVESLPDIAILDLNLPDGRSVEVLTSPAEDGAFPILLMTSFGNEHVAVEAIKAGALDYIVKSPEAFSQLPRIVEQALREWHLLIDRKRAERDIRESEARFHTISNQFNALLDTLPDRIILHDPGLKVIWANRAATGEQSAGDITSGEPRCYKLWNNQAAPCDPCPVMRSLHSGESAVDIFTTNDGKVWELRSIPVKEDGRIVSIIEIGRDISEQRKLEEQLRQSQKMDAVGRLAGGVAHDYNNMLNVMMGYVELALKRVDADDLTHSYLQEVLHAGIRSADLTKQLLSFSRKQIVKPRVLDINQTISSQIGFWSKLIGEEIQIRFVSECDAGTVLLDPTQLDQVLLNLIVNARDAIAGLGIITITTAAAALDSSYCQSRSGILPGDYVRICISDTGCGMDAATRDRIFEPFFTTKELVKGTGLGLATVFGIVTQSNGEIRVESEPAKGTTFIIHIPRLIIGKAENPAGTETGLLRGTETILLVEDDVQSLDITRLLLEECGYRVISSASPAEASSLYELHAGEIALLLSDVIMPQMNGRELYDSIRIITPGIRVLFMSGYTHDVISSRGVIPEGINFIHKPFTISSLARKVRDVLDDQ